jgi:stress-induced-phosphoprotein 1
VQVRAAVKKEEGNTFVKSAEYAKALKCYTDAIELDPTEHTIYSNRSMCYERLARWGESEADAREVIRLKPDFPKGHVRLIKALKEGKKPSAEIVGAIAQGKAAVGAKDLDGFETEVARIVPKLVS